MSDAAFLYLVLFGLYVVECFAWVAVDNTLFVWRPWSGYVPTSPVPFLRNDRGGLAFTCILPPIVPALALRLSLHRPLASPAPVPPEDDPSSFATAYDQLRIDLRWLGYTSALYWFYMLFVVPVDASLFGLLAIAPRLLLTIAALALVNAAAFFVAHRRLARQDRWARIGHTLKVLFFPPAAFRAPDIIARNALAIYHPLVAASALCREKTFLKISGEYVRALVYPTTSEKAACALTDGCETLTSDYRAFVDRLLSSHDTGVITLLRQSVPVDSGAVYYCPRCLSSFTQSIEQCPDCAGVSIAKITAPNQKAAPA